MTHFKLYGRSPLVFSLPIPKPLPSLWCDSFVRNEISTPVIPGSVRHNIYFKTKSKKNIITITQYFSHSHTCSQRFTVANFGDPVAPFSRYKHDVILRIRTHAPSSRALYQDRTQNQRKVSYYHLYNVIGSWHVWMKEIILRFIYWLIDWLIDWFYFILSFWHI